ncbi:MAG: hypothetical protein HYS41_06820 [Candidatus Omnitrophica bacterium]|nr:hypothetical protein [Candidatus Omnitrophota bacterium]
MKRFIRPTTLVLVAALLAGCASIIHGSQQSVRVMSSPSGAVVRVNLNSMATTTPGVLSLNRKEVGYVLTFEKQGYKPVEVSLRRTVDGWLFGNILFGGIVGIVIDFASGSAYKLTPDEVTMALDRMGASLKDTKGDLLFVVDLERLPEKTRQKIARNGLAA